VDVRIDEGRCDDVPVLRPRLDRADQSVRDDHAQRLVDALDGREHAPFQRERVVSAVPREQHYATTACDGIATGATVRTS
jgi:hypothetical protein